MLSYRHSYHAGNVADVFKHTVLINIIDYFKRKDKAFCYIDTHAGAGMYSLKSEHAEKTQEYHEGIAKIWKKSHLPPALTRYIEVLTACGLTDSFEQYAGSPFIAHHLLRHQDYGFFYELHSTDSQQLQDLLAKSSHSQVHQQDGFQQCLAVMPPIQKRGLVFIDPSYEMKEDYRRVVTTLVKLQQRFSTGTYILWYPVVERQRINELERKLKVSALKNVQLFELGQLADSLEQGMTASGMIIVNAPWTLAAEMHTTLPYLAKELGRNGQGHFRIKQLIEE